MALVLKTGETFTDDFGVTHNSLYGVVDWCLTDKDAKTHDMILKLYASKSARLSKKTPIVSNRINCVDKDLFDQYFSVQAIDTGGNQYKQSYAYILSECKNESGDLVFGYLESDE